MITRGRVAPLLALGLVLSASAAASAGPPTDRLRAFFAAANRAIADPATEDRPLEKLAAVQRLVSEIGDWEAAAVQALGSEWDVRTPAERDEFVRLFAGLLQRAFVMVMASRARVDGGVAVTWTGEQVDGDAAAVTTAVHARNGSEFAVEYRMVRTGQAWRIRDVVIDGVSLVDNYHAQLAAILRRSSYAELIATVRSRTGDSLVLAGTAARRLAASLESPGDGTGGPIIATDAPSAAIALVPIAPGPPRQSPEREVLRPREILRPRDVEVATPVAVPAPPPDPVALVPIRPGTRDAGAAPVATIRQGAPAAQAPEARPSEAAVEPAAARPAVPSPPAAAPKPEPARALAAATPAPVHRLSPPARAATPAPAPSPEPARPARVPAAGAIAPTSEQPAASPTPASPVAPDTPPPVKPVGARAAAAAEAAPPRQAALAADAPAPRFTERVALAIGLARPKYWVQVGAFRSTDAAARLIGRMRSWALTIVMGPLTRALGAPQDSLARVLVGPFTQRADAVAALHRLRASGIAGFVAEDHR